MQSDTMWIAVFTKYPRVCQSMTVTQFFTLIYFIDRRLRAFFRLGNVRYRCRIILPFPGYRPRPSRRALLRQTSFAQSEAASRAGQTRSPGTVTLNMPGQRKTRTEPYGIVKLYRNKCTKKEKKGGMSCLGPTTHRAGTRTAARRRWCHGPRRHPSWTASSS